MTKPTIVLLHGVGLDHTMWEPVATLLGREFEVMAPDLLGHGKKPLAHDAITLGDLAEAVAAELPPKSHLVGFSLGALIAQHLALHRPEQVVTLTSVSSVCRRTAEEKEAVLRRLRLAAADFPASASASLHRWFDGTDVEPAWVRRTEATLMANDPASFINCYLVFATADAEIGAELDQIAVPALAITGERDPGSTPEMTRRLAAALPDCREVVVPGARHMLPVEQPGALVASLTSLIRENVHV